MTVDPAALAAVAEFDGRVLDRLPRRDPASRDHPILAAVPPDRRDALRSWTWAMRHPTLDQGREGRCVEFAFCHELLASPAPVSKALIAEILRGRRIYWPAQRRDPWPGGSYPGASPTYEGTSVLAGAKTVVDLGLADGYRWSFSLRELCAGLAWEGPAVIGVWWHRSMFRPDVKGWVRPDGRKEGGHCVSVLGARYRDARNRPVPRQALLEGGLDAADLQRSYGIVQQSWGPGHGDRGRVYLSLQDLWGLLADDGESCFLMGRRRPTVLPPESVA